MTDQNKQESKAEMGLVAQKQVAVVSTDGFSQKSLVPRVETSSDVLAAQAKAAVEAKYIMALRNPRDLDAVRQDLLKECQRTSFAQVARYRKPIGGTTADGFSIRFAEAAIRCMRNIPVDVNVIYDDDARRITRVTVTDLESNTSYSKDIILEKTVERKQLRAGQVPLSSRTNSKGEKTYRVEATEDDIFTKESAMTSKIIRQAGLRLVKGDILDECEEVIMETLRKAVAQDPEAEKKRLIDAFDDMGVRVNDLKAYLGMSDLSSLSPKDLVNLRGVYQAIKDGETNWQEIMEQREKARGSSKKEDEGEGRATPSKGDSKSSEVSAKLSDALKKKVGGSPSEQTAGIPQEQPATPAKEPTPVLPPTPQEEKRDSAAATLFGLGPEKEHSQSRDEVNFGKIYIAAIAGTEKPTALDSLVKRAERYRSKVSDETWNNFLEKVEARKMEM